MSGFRPRFFVTLPDRVRSEAAERAADPRGPEPLDADLCGVELPLDPEDSHHASRVLRLRLDDECEVVVGGDANDITAVFAATVCAPSDPVRVKLASRLEGAAAGACYRTRVGLVQALGRPAAMEYVLEKGTEVGASFFWFVSSTGSPARLGRMENDHLTRWRRIVREAAKQSKQIVIPEVGAPASVGEAVDRATKTGIFSVVLDPEASDGLHDLVRGAPAAGVPGRRIALWIGPEGGWTSAERAEFSAAGMAAARLGRSVLRTETAGPVAVAVARLALGDW
ncbi:MAG: 16S rRNA (uracil(1498)-N(3))-methyltransferase [Thermoleophilia bacterium]|nr:16S rRNA (uracil(1498)-N(3))-methyltransferase [Thermoleophilia bacterium]